ncbi:MAG: nickel/cobalt transporter, partial [Dehalococcoidia bacterium]
REASFTFVPGTGVAAPPVQSAGASATVPETAPERPGGAFSSLITVSDLSLPLLLVSLLAARGFGALHALEPGHGKTFVAAYFVGVRGTARQALILGLIIATTHTVGVLAIGLVTLYGSKFILPEQLYPWLSLASGLLVVGLGLRLLAVRLKWSHLWNRAAESRRATAHEKAHRHGAGSHRGHSHEVTAKDGSPLPWRSLLALGLADGLVPSPSTLVVLLAAISLDRIGLGFLLIVAFSVGLAGVLALVSLILVYARQMLHWLGSRRWPLRSHPYLGWLLGNITPEGRLLTVIPVGGALVLVVVGLGLTVRALSQPGLLGV